MRLYELVENSNMSLTLDILVDQLKDDVDDEKIDKEIKVDDFIKFLGNNGIPVKIDNLYDMIQVPPLNKIVNNIKPDPETDEQMIVFKGGDEEISSTADQKSDQEKTVAQMAKKAMKK